MLRDDFDLRLTNELIETYLKIAYGIKPGCWLDAEIKEGVQELLKIYDQENFGTIFR